MNILGISAFYHDSACCLLREGTLVAAAAEERFSRLKHDAGLPVRAFRYCLEAAGLDLVDLDAVAYYESPVKKLARQLWSGQAKVGAVDLPWLDALRPERAIRERLGWDGELLSFDHHASHAASAYYYSGFDEAAVLTVDGVGEWASTTYSRGEGAKLELFEQVDFPHSLGLLYSAITAYLGFRVNSGEYKVMGLAPYGEPRYLDAMDRLLFAGPEGQFELDMEFFDFLAGERMVSDRLGELFGHPARIAEGPIESHHQDIARSLQVTLERLLLAKVGYLARVTGSRQLCMAGGVALNCVANGRIRRQGPFAEVFVQPAAGDSGGCLGAAALAHVELTGERPATGMGAPDDPRHGAQCHVSLGPSWSAQEVCRLLDSTGLARVDYPGREAELVEAVARRLADGQVVGWFQGRMEHGPRALGGRSILASPLNEEMGERINAAIKRREAFRPFAPAVLVEKAADHFDLQVPSPFMLETCQVCSPLALPAVTHVDGSARPQTVDRRVLPRFAALLDAFERRTGCPILLNTSFNVRGEPIVCTPVDALSCFAVSGLDALVIEDCLLDRAALPASWPALARLLRGCEVAKVDTVSGSVDRNLYSFV